MMHYAVVPAQAGTQVSGAALTRATWAPACAGATVAARDAMVAARAATFEVPA
jgi:hypothetical protein